MPLKSERVSSGFRINWADLINNDTGVILWHTNENYALPDIEHEAIIPRQVLDCRAVTRTMNFSFMHQINHLRIKHKEFLQGNCIEEFDYEFGTVFAGSVINWETTFAPRQEITSSSANVIRYLYSVQLEDTSFCESYRVIMPAKPDLLIQILNLQPYLDTGHLSNAFYV